MSISVLFLVLAAVMFLLSTWSRWWANPTPFYPTLVSLGLFFLTMAQLWPVIVK